MLQWGLLVCLLGLVFGLVIYSQLKNLPVHRSMLEVSELIYETCKTYLLTQGKFILILWVFIGADHGRLLRPVLRALRSAVEVVIILLVQPGRHRRQLRGGLVRHPHQHLRQLPHRVGGARGQAAIPVLRDPAQGGHVASAWC